MNIADLINSGANVTLNISASDLLEVINSAVASTRKEFEQSVISDKAEAYLTANEVAEIVGVTKVTLWRWAKRGYLIPIEVGGKRKYLERDIQSLLSKKNND